MIIAITPEACWFLRTMIVSCGSAGCMETMRLLEAVTKEVSLDSVGKIEGYGYRLKAFERLERFAKEENITKIDLDQIVRYFGGSLHIEIMKKYASHAGLARFLGEAAGLVTHVLLPLNKDGEYENAGRKVKFEDAFWLNPNSEGIPCFHLGLIVKVDIESDLVDRIKKEQADSKDFMDYLDELPDVLKIPSEYYTALNCLAQK